MGLWGPFPSPALLNGAETCRLHVPSFLSAVSDQVWPVGATNQIFKQEEKGSSGIFLYSLPWVGPLLATTMSPPALTPLPRPSVVPAATREPWPAGSSNTTVLRSPVKGNLLPHGRRCSQQPASCCSNYRVSLAGGHGLPQAAWVLCLRGTG